ncbi:MAG: hypothetical protein MMC23_000718 [Stictis urceolatum]|nr:hypothetical protein [Stictis urceolata]
MNTASAQRPAIGRHVEPIDLTDDNAIDVDVNHIRSLGRTGLLNLGYHRPFRTSSSSTLIEDGTVALTHLDPEVIHLDSDDDDQNTQSLSTVSDTPRGLVEDMDFEEEPPPLPPHIESPYVDHDFEQATSFHLSHYIVPDSTTKLVSGTDIALADGNFLRIVDILRQYNSSFQERTVFRGYLLAKNGSDPTPMQDLSCVLPAKPNELCWIVNILEDSIDDEPTQSFVVVDSPWFLEVVHIRFTNALFPELNDLLETADGYDVTHHWNDMYSLVCRWKITMTWPSHKTRLGRIASHCARKFEALRPSECDIEYAYNERELMDKVREVKTACGGEKSGVCKEEYERRWWETKKLVEAEVLRSGGSPAARSTPDSAIQSLSEGDDNDQTAFQVEAEEFYLGEDLPDSYWYDTSEIATGPHIRLGLRRYTFGDYFAGFGGASRAAVMAGLHVKYAVEREAAPCNSYMRNFPGTKLAHTDVVEFVTNINYGKRAEIVHLSPPCQPFSRCHTHVSKNDHENRKPVHFIERVLHEAKPRGVTLENADGLCIIRKHLGFFRSILRQFAALGYSVEARVVNLAQYGLAQSRRRLIIVATCPGQRLPQRPVPTHADTDTALRSHGRLRPWKTINEVIETVPDQWMNHADELAVMKPLQRSPFDGNRRGATLMCKGLKPHPSGERALTSAEMEAIQEIPLYHEFGTDPKTGQPQSRTTKGEQVGNAVPAGPMKKIFEAMKWTFLEDDGFLEEVD